MKEIEIMFTLNKWENPEPKNGIFLKTTMSIDVIDSNSYPPHMKEKIKEQNTRNVAMILADYLEKNGYRWSKYTSEIDTWIHNRFYGINILQIKTL